MKAILFVIAVFAVAIGIAVTAASNRNLGEHAVALPAAKVAASEPAGATHARVVFAGGCFWGVQAVFQHTDGVLAAVSGYAGGKAGDAHYGMVSTGRTGHAEAVEVTYDPRRITFGKLLQIYFSVAHDPTQLNRQGPDAGTQYRSAIFHVTPAQRQVAQQYIAQLEEARVFGDDRIVTQLVPLTEFFIAEAQHQDYATRHPGDAYIATFDRPKLEALQRLLPEVWRDKPVLVMTGN
jgi:peptide-methionine (S)-S-oxide reductase